MAKGQSRGKSEKHGPVGKSRNAKAQELLDKRQEYQNSKPPSGSQRGKHGKKGG